MLTVITPAASRRLTTVPAVREELGFEAGIPTDDVILGLIDAATSTIESFCNRVFARETVLETLRPERQLRRMVLERFPVTTVASIVENDETLAPADYELNPSYGIVLRLHGDRLDSWCTGKILITYTAGWLVPDQVSTDLPKDIERAALRLVGAYWSTRSRADSLVKREDVQGIGSVEYWMPGQRNALPDPEAEQLLSPYRRLVIE